MGDDLRDDDGTLLLTNDQVAELVGVQVKTVNYYNSLRLRATPPGPLSALMPEPVRRMKLPVAKSNGFAMVWKQLWREDDILEWRRQRMRAGAGD